MDKITIIVDGSPNKVACIFKRGKEEIHRLLTIPQSTNNDAELKAIFLGLSRVSSIFETSHITEVEVQSDSNNAIQWCTGAFRCRTDYLLVTLNNIKVLERSFGKVTYVWTPDNPAGKLLKH